MMMRKTELVALMMPLSVLVAGGVGAGEAEALWEAHVRPMVDEQCVKCHGPIEEKSGLEVDTVEGILKGGDEGTAVVPGKPEESRMYLYLAAGAETHMPPKKQVSEAEREAVRQWIVALGAPKEAEAVVPAVAGPVTEDPAVAIDHFIEAGWRAGGIEAAPKCDDRTFVRRVWLDLAGVLPTAEVQEAFVRSDRADKREALIAERLAGPEYGRTMRELWDVVLMGRGGDGKAGQRAEHGWHAYLERAFNANRPWPQVLREIIVGRPDGEETKGSQWFLYEREAKHQEMAEAIAPVIYGTRLDCAQCHDHPLAREIRQGHYWGLVAAFNRSKRAEGGPPAVDETAVGGFMNFTNLKKESQAAVVALLHGPVVEEVRPGEGEKEADGEEKYVSGGGRPKVPKFSRRAALAEAATRDNPLPARAMVNRTWAQLFGRGLVHPVDEINSRNKASHPELLEWLTADFLKSGGDVKRLVGAIVRSGAWQRAAWGGAGEPPAAARFAAFAERVLPAETIARSMAVVAGRSVPDEALAREMAAKFPDVMPREYLATTQQAMFLTNSTVMAGLLGAADGAAVELAKERDDAVLVRRTFEVVLGRGPEADEAGRAQEFVARRGDPARRATAVAGLMWSLMCGPEFLTNH